MQAVASVALGLELGLSSVAFALDLALSFDFQLVHLFEEWIEVDHYTSENVVIRKKLISKILKEPDSI